jgi:hypothetical protein
MANEQQVPMETNDISPESERLHEDSEKTSVPTFELFALHANSLEECKEIYRQERGSLEEIVSLHKDSFGGKNLIKIALDSCNDDFFKLYAVWLDESEYSQFISDAAFEEVIKKCTSLEMLYLLYLSLKEEVQPDTDYDRHQKIVCVMIKRCDGDEHKLARLYFLFNRIPQFVEQIREEMQKTRGV